MADTDGFTAAIASEAARLYAPAGRAAMHFAAGKLRHDPIFAAVLARGLVANGARVVDLGCGHGVLFAWLVAARRRFLRGEWSVRWPAPPDPGSMTGFDLRARAVRTARAALADRARLEEADIRSVRIPACDVVTIFDVLHYLADADQEAVLDRCAHALSGGGALLLRVADADAGWRFAVTLAADHLVTWLRGAAWPRFRCRPLREWVRGLEARGFAVEAIPMSAGTPFANVLLNARK